MPGLHINLPRGCEAQSFADTGRTGPTEGLASAGSTHLSPKHFFLGIGASLRAKASERWTSTSRPSRRATVETTSKHLQQRWSVNRWPTTTRTVEAAPKPALEGVNRVCAQGGVQTSQPPRSNDVLPSTVEVARQVEDRARDQHSRMQTAFANSQTFPPRPVSHSGCAWDQHCDRGKQSFAAFGRSWSDRHKDLSRPLTKTASLAKCPFLHALENARLRLQPPDPFHLILLRTPAKSPG